jgi:hypothetical protein
MTTYAPNFTPRVKLHYLAAGIEHTTQFRKQRGATGSDMTGVINQMRALFNVWAGRLPEDFEFLSAEFALTDSDDFFAMGLPTAVVGSQPVASYSLRQRCTSTNFVGKATDSRAGIFLYGILWDDGLGEEADNGRVFSAENALVPSSLAILNVHGYAGNGNTAAFKAYANIKINDGLLKKLRSGAIS